MPTTSYIDKAKELKRIGAIKYDLRHTLTKSQKARINREYTNYSPYITRPDLFQAHIVRKKSARNLKRSGYLVTPRGRAIIPLQGSDKITIKSDGRIIRVNGDETEVIYLNTGRGGFMDRLEKLTKKKLGRNQMVTVRIGPHSQFKTAFTSYSQLFWYMNNQFSPNNDDESPEDIWPVMSVVTITSKAPIAQIKVLSRKEGNKGTPTKRKSRKIRKDKGAK